jgi:hypothetical protein
MGVILVSDQHKKCKFARDNPMLREARHPCVVRTFGGGDFIPNDTVIGIADVSLL